MYLPLPQARGITALRARRDGAGPKAFDIAEKSSSHVAAHLDRKEAYLDRNAIGSGLESKASSSDAVALDFMDDHVDPPAVAFSFAEAHLDPGAGPLDSRSKAFSFTAEASSFETHHPPHPKSCESPAETRTSMGSCHNGLGNRQTPVVTNGLEAEPVLSLFSKALKLPSRLGFRRK